jgi:hypothetical protein
MGEYLEFLINDYIIRGYFLLVAAIVLLLIPIFYYKTRLNQKREITQQIVDELERIEMKLSDSSSIKDKYNIVYFPFACIECFEHYNSIVLELLRQNFGDEFGSFLPRKVPVVHSEDWLTFDQVIPLRTDVQVILKRLRARL